jgi:uncharacterized RDD family membrane protein YckC
MSQNNLPSEKVRRCEVTGEILPADSLVQFRGKWVSEKGKQILLERLQSGEPVGLPGILRPGVWRRLLCISFDNLVLILLNLAIMFLLGLVGVGPLVSNSAGNAHHVSTFLRGIGIGQIVVFLIGTAYFGIMQAAGGQTLGKRIGREKVVRKDGSPIGTKTAFIRGACYVMPNLLFGIGALSGDMNFLFIWYVASIIWALADILFLVNDSRLKRALHDRVAGTKVILLPK